MKVEFDKISDESRIWIYQSNDDFTEFDVDVINKKSDFETSYNGLGRSLSTRRNGK